MCSLTRTAMKVPSATILLLSVLVLPTFGQKKLKQGIEGKVFWVEGNQMPGPDKVASPEMGVEREILVYEATRMADVKMEGMFFTEISTKMVAQLASRPDGSFKMRLPPGQYSVFVREPNGLYANLFDSNNLINPVIVKPKAFTWLTIAIDYKAAY